MISEWENKYGTISSLNQKILISKCASPDKMTDFVLWKNLSQGADFEDRIVVEDPGLFEVLSPRRVELLEYLTENEPSSIKNLAKSLRRDYKNVYDDLQALASFDLVELLQSGRSLRPTAAVTEISVMFED